MTRYIGNTVVYIDILPSSFLGLWVCCDLNDLVDLCALVTDLGDLMDLVTLYKQIQQIFQSIR